MRTRALLALVAFAILAGPALTAAAPARGFTFYNVRGHVTDTNTGLGLSGVCIILRPPDECRDTDFKTDAFGNWGPAPLVSGSSWDIYYVLPGYVIGHDFVPASQETDIFLESKIAQVGAPPPPAPCDTPGSSTQSVYLPNITKTLGGPTGWNTPFIVQNVGTAPTTLEVSYYAFTDGRLVACRKVASVAPGTSFADIPNNDAFLPGDSQFSVVVRSFGAAVVSVVNQVQGSGASFQSLAYDGASAGATTVFLPNVTRRFFGYDVPFIVQNLGATTTVATASFISFDGSQTFTRALTIAPGRSGVIDPDFTPGLVDGTQYAVTVRADQPVSVVANAHNESGAPVAYSHNGLALGATSLYAPYVAKNAGSGKRVSPVVVQNVSAAAVDVTLTFTPLGGGAPQAFTYPAVPAGASRAFDPRFTIGTQSPCNVAGPTCLGNGEYALRVNATGNVAAVVLPITDLTAGAYAAAPAVTARQYLPNVTRTLGGPSGYTTPIYLQSAGASTATLRWFRFSDGSLVQTQNASLPASGTIVVDPRTVAGLSEDTQYAVIVDGTGGGVNSIVYQQNFAGGDGVMVYEGFAQ